MAFVLTLVYIFLLYVRPLDLAEGYENLPVMAWLGTFNIMLTVGAWYFSPPRERSSLSAPQIWLTVLFVCLAIVPWLRIRWLDEAKLAVLELQPTLGAFLMVAINVNTMKRMRWFVSCLVLCLTITAAQGIVSYHTGWRHDMFILDQRSDAESEEEVQIIPRMRHLGFLNDPNDFAQSLVTTLPLLAAGWRPKKRLVNYGILVPLAAFLLWGIALTRSRGGLVALAAAALLALRERLGRINAAVLTGLLIAAVLLLNFGAGRLVKDASAEGRIEAWASGLLMLRSNPLLGVGYKGFIGVHRGLTAHNSLVQAFTETGLIGYFVWMALLVLTYMELSRLTNLRGDDPPIQNIRKWARLLRLALSAFLAAAYFLSRAYVVTLYLLIALALCLKDVARRQGYPIEKITARIWSKETIKWEFLTMFLVWLSVKLAGAG